ncbi:MAG: nuclear transport factor 2 family protein [Pseudomonadota bacterium]
MLAPAVDMTGYSPHLQKWMDYMIRHDASDLPGLLHDDVVFTSPVVFTPQRGKAITLAYLGAAGATLGGDTFRYVRIFDCHDRAVLEFECEMDGKYVNGIDMIEWDEDGLIVDFKVLVRPLQAVQTVHAAMGAMLEKMMG